MSFLPNAIIKKRHSELFISHYDENFVREASYDLRLGPEAYLVGETTPKTLTDDEPYLSLQPGQFAILTCYEHVSMPRNIIGFLSIRSRFKFAGLVNISGFHVDPTHKGTLLFAVQNVGPSDIRVKFKEPTFTIFFANLQSDEIGKGRSGELKGIRLEDVQLLGGGSITLTALQKEVERLRTLLLIYAPFAVAAFLGLLFMLLKSGH